MEEILARSPEVDVAAGDLLFPPLDQGFDPVAFRPPSNRLASNQYAIVWHSQQHLGEIDRFELGTSVRDRDGAGSNPHKWRGFQPG